MIGAAGHGSPRHEISKALDDHRQDIEVWTGGELAWASAGRVWK